MSKDKVGYRNPPKATRFQKGKSGNLKGRPKGKQNFKSLSRVLRDCLLEEVEAVVNGKRRKMLRLEAVVAKQFTQAMNGNPQSAKFLIGLAENHLPANLSIEEMMADQPVFGWNPEDEELLSKAKLLEGVKVTYKKKPENGT
jgi:hypothetical protein